VEGLWANRTHTGIIVSANYSLLARVIEVNDEHSAIIESQSLNSSSAITTFPYMAETPEEVARQFEEQARV